MRIDELIQTLVVNTDFAPVSPPALGPGYKATLAQIVSAGLYQPNSSTAGAGANLTIKAADGVTSGAGGSIILQPGAQATTGGNGVVIVRQPGGTAGTDEGQIYHDGTDLYIVNKEGGSVSNSVRLQTNAGYGIYTSNRGTGSFSYLDSTSGQLFIAYQSSVNLSYWNVNGFTGAFNTFSDAYRLYWPGSGLLSNAGAILSITGGSSSGTSNGGSLAYTASTPTALSANTDNLVLTGSAFQRLSASAAYNLTGIAPPSGGTHVDGRVIWLHNVGSFNITLKHSATSTAANQFITETSGDLVLGPNRIVQCTYDGTSAKWRAHGETYPYIFPTADGTNGQVLVTNGSGTLSWSTNGNASASGTTNYVAKFTGTTSLGDGIIFDNGTHVGIGTTTLNQIGGSRTLSINSNLDAGIELNANNTVYGVVYANTNGLGLSGFGAFGMRFYTASAIAGSAERMRIDASGNVGIGTASPSYRLHVSGQTYLANGSSNPLYIEQTVADGTTRDSIYLYEASAQGTGRQAISWYNGNTGYYKARIYTEVGPGYNATKFYIDTADNARTVATRLCISNGNIGINTTSPDAPLHILNKEELRIETTTATQAARLRLINNSGGNWFVGAGAWDGTSNFQIVQSGSATAGINITTAGNVGIGNTGPGAKLQVDTGSAATKGLIVKGFTSQSATLQEWQNSSGTALATVSAAGTMILNPTRSTNPYFQIFPSGDSYNVFKIYSPSASWTGAGSSVVYEMPDSNNTITTSWAGTMTMSSTVPIVLKANNIYSNNPYVAVFATNTEVARFTQTGLLGVGTTSPGAMIQATTTAAATKGLIVRGFTSQSANLQEWQDSSSNILGYVSPTGSISSKFFEVKNQFVGQSGQPTITFTGAGNVPIALKVLDDSFGTLSFEGSAGQLFSINNNLASGIIFSVNDISGIPQIDVNADGTIRLAPFASNVQIAGLTAGKGAGSISTNTALGVSALAANTTGSTNTAIGYNALLACTTSSGNTAVGNDALKAVTTGGGSNTAVGDSALRGITTGVYNTAVGLYSALNMTTASGTVSVGMFAGRWLNDRSTALTAPSNSIYIGHEAFGFSATETNAIVIGGYQAAGKGSNTTVIGTTSTTQAWIYGTGIIYNYSNSDNYNENLRLPESGSGYSVIHMGGAAATSGTGNNQWALLKAGAALSHRFEIRHNTTAVVSILTDGSVGIGTTSQTSKFQVNNSGSTGSPFYVDAGNPAGTTTLFAHTGANTPVPFRLTKSGAAGSGSYGLLDLFYDTNTAGHGSNLYFSLDDSAGNITEYGGIGARINANTNGSERGDLYFYTMNTGTGRAEQMVLRYDGNLGIGTTNPAAQLHLAKAGQAQFDMQNTTTGGTPANGAYWRTFVDNVGGGGGNLTYGFYDIRNSRVAMGIDNSGNVGINTTSPAAKLQVSQSTAGAIGLQVSMPTGAETTQAGIRVFGYSPAIELMDKDSIQNWYMGIDDNDSNKLLFGRGYGPGQGVTQAMTIDVSDNVGIGTSAPGSRFQVDTGAAATKGIIVRGFTSQSANLQEWQNSSGNALLRVTSAGDIYRSGGTADLYIGTDNGYGIVYQADNNGHRFQVWSGAWTDRMVILESGNVGVGTSSPSNLMHIVGSNDNSATYYSQLRIDGTGAYPLNIAGISLNPNTAVQSHIRFLENGTAKAQLRFNQANSSTNKLSVYSFTTSTDMFTMDCATGYVGIGTYSPTKSLTIAQNGSAPGVLIYKSPDGTLNASQLTAALGSGSSFTNSGTSGGNEYGICQLFHNGTTRVQLYAYDVGVGNSTNFALDAFTFGAVTSFAQVGVVAKSASTPAIVSRGFTSQTAPLLMFQDSSANTLGYVAANGLNSGTFNDYTWTPNYSGGVSSPSSGTYQKTSGNSNVWDGHVYSSEGFAKNVHVTFKASQTNAYLMMGLNSDPATDASYSSLDYAWYPRNDGILEIYESNVSIGTFGAYTTATVLTVAYDGTNVIYLKDGTIMRTVVRAVGNLLYLDSSFYTLNGAVNSVRYGPTNIDLGSFSARMVSTYNTATGLSTFSVPKTLIGNIHFANGSGTNTSTRYQAALTFMGSSSSESQAGIYVTNDNSTGTHMGFATTDSYATGPQLGMTISNTGAISFPRAATINTPATCSIGSTGNNGGVLSLGASYFGLRITSLNGDIINGNVNTVNITPGAGGNTTGLNVTGNMGASGIVAGFTNVGSASSKVMVVKGQTSQSGNLQEWQNSSGTVLSAIDSSGEFTGRSTATKRISDSNGSFEINIGAIYSPYGGGSFFSDAVANDVFIRALSARILLGTTSGNSHVIIQNASPNVTIQCSAATAKGLIVRGAASQSANLQEWQNSSGTVLASADSAGNISTPRLIAPIHSSSSSLQLWHADNVADAASSGISFGYSNWGSGYMPTHWTFKRTLPDTSGNFVELFSLPGQQASYFELTVVAYKHAEAFESKSYVFATQYLTGGGILQPTFSHNRSPGFAGFFGNHFEVELNTNVEPAVVRVRRTSTSGTSVAIFAHLRGMHLQGITEKTGTGTSSISLSSLHGTQQVFPTALAPSVVSSGAGNNIGLYAGSGVSSGAGGSVILQPGAQATSGGNGNVVVRQPGGSAGTDEIQLSHDGGKGSIINKDGVLQLGGANIAIRNVANNANTTLTATVLYATGLLSSDSITADGVVSDTYSWSLDSSSLNWNQGFHIRVSWSHIRGYGCAGIAYTGNNTNGRYSTLEITDGSSNGGALAYRSTDHTISANTNDLTPTRFSAVQRWSPTANYSVTGLAAGGSTSFSGGTPTSWIHTNGRVIWVHNVATAYNITLKHEDAGSTAGNRFLTETGTDIILPPNSMVMLTYDGTSSRWRVHTLSSAVKVASSTNNISTATNDLALSYSNFQRLNCTTACNLTGVAPPSGGVHTDGRIMRIVNTGTANLTLVHNSASSATANRFFNVAGANLVIAPNDYAELMYDATDNGRGTSSAGWRVY